jgi:hypothetical protein
MNNNDDDDHRETRPLLRTLDAGMGEERKRRKDEGADGDLNACSRKIMVPPFRVLRCRWPRGGSNQTGA